MNSFDQKKASIIAQIDGTDEKNPDASPKGTIDEPIIPLIKLINSHSDMVTTSSCSGRVSVFLEGVKVKNDEEKLGGKGDGGKWLFITHDPNELNETGWWARAKNYVDDHDCSGPRRFLIYKFEAMVCRSRYPTTCYRALRLADE
jgi:tRNA wybutosine-synthesizing protein 3